MAELPTDVVETILVRLPVKSLKRFQCVEKSWCLLINSKSFIHHHLLRSYDLYPSSNHHLIIKDGGAVFSTNFDHLNNSQKINLPFSRESVCGLMSVCGFSNSCNGLVLVKSDPPILWNPFTTEYKVLSGKINQFPAIMWNLSVYGFAYDYINDDYKVVRVVYRLNNIRVNVLRTEIYSLKFDSWRQIDNFPYFLPITQESLSVHVHGALHTIVKLERFPSILAFSVVNETHYKIELPPSCNTKATTLGNIGDHLSVVSCHNSHFDIWMMKDYRVMESWIKLISIAQPHIKPFEKVNLLACSIDCYRVLLSCDGRKLQCDWRNKTVEFVRCKGLPYHFHAEGCVESLVSLSKEKLGTSHLYERLATDFGDLAPFHAK